MKLLCLLGSLSLLMNLAFAEDKRIYGLHEHALLVDFNRPLEAKLDTGAKTASLNAQGIKRFRRDGKSWVRFYLDNEQAQPIERPLLRTSRIKRRADDYDEEDERGSSARPVIALSVCLGNRLQQIEVNLTDRSAFRYPLLIGSEALKQFSALIDPSLEHVTGRPSCAALSLAE
ncbi:ATP-dependent zinc protease [Ventosimonas gracilis]|uniref:ATP-dependent zinc protease n=1 Tax=Ventosimonas gracilis TaxID=1680762 RepID=A0A139SQB6_9GAMM|nr:ATP-dependent zinc protease [Ventosimonas gracilis]KXU36789.1 ATP-dependent zinc protease [Ventosimonas gracilis]